MGESSYNYVRWDLVCEIMNHFVIENATAQFDEATEKLFVKLTYTGGTPVASILVLHNWNVLTSITYVKQVPSDKPLG